MILSGVIGSMVAAPTVIRRVYKTNYLHQMREEREIQRQRLRENVVQMSSLERTLEEQRTRVEKLVTVYGLDRSLGQGGFSTAAKADPTTEQLSDARHREISLKNAMKRLQEQLELLAAVRDRERGHGAAHAVDPPVPSDQFVLTSPFGMRVSPFTRAADFHKGLDLSAPRGTPVYVTADGVVTFAGRYPLRQSVTWWRFGNVVVVNHANRFITIYGHLDSINVRAGQQVKQGETIATVGSTGWSTNSHLHYEVRSDLEAPGTYVPIDPRIYILNYEWNNEASLLIKARTSKDYKNFDPLPPAFIGRRRG